VREMESARPPAPATSRVWGGVALGSGVLSAALNCAFVFRPVSPSRLDPVNSFISELEVPGQPFSELFRWASVLSGVAAVVFAVGLYRRIPPGLAGRAGCWALALFGLAGAVDALIPMDCAPSASVVCLRRQEEGPMSWPYQAHTWFDVAGTVAVLASLWLLGRHLHRHPGWHLVAVSGRAGAGLLAAGSVVLTVMSIRYLPGVGLVQRLEVLAISAWMVVLALAQRRQPGG
jgi:Protein of unknown function (DUF998)